MDQLKDAARQTLEAWQTSSYGQPSHQKAMVLAMTSLRAALMSVTDVAEQPAEQEPTLKQALTDPENQPNQFGVEFLMHGQKFAFKVGVQQFTLDYEPTEPGEFEFMGNALIHAFSTFTPDVKAEQPAEQEPVAWMCSNTELMHKGYQMFSATGGGDWNIPVYTAPQPAKPAEQEPVAHLKKLLDAMHRESNAKHNLNEWLRASPAFAQRASQAEAEWVVAVKHLVAMQMDAEKYAAGHTAPQPTKRVPLTDEEIDAVPWGPHDGNPITFAEALRDFARAIERAHGIGETK